jgi:hypothetical protein
VELIEVDALDAEPAERGLALAPNGRGGQDPSRKRHAIGLVPDQAAFREDERTLGRRQLSEQPSHDLFGMPQAAHRGRVDPVDAQVERVPHRGQRDGVVLRPQPNHQPPPPTAHDPNPTRVMWRSL